MKATIFIYAPTHVSYALIKQMMKHDNLSIFETIYFYPALDNINLLKLINNQIFPFANFPVDINQLSDSKVETLIKEFKAYKISYLVIADPKVALQDSRFNYNFTQQNITVVGATPQMLQLQYQIANSFITKQKNALIKINRIELDLNQGYKWYQKLNQLELQGIKLFPFLLSFFYDDKYQARVIYSSDQYLSDLNNIHKNQYFNQEKYDDNSLFSQLDIQKIYLTPIRNFSYTYTTFDDRVDTIEHKHPLLDVVSIHYVVAFYTGSSFEIIGTSRDTDQPIDFTQGEFNSCCSPSYNDDLYLYDNVKLAIEHHITEFASQLNQLADKQLNPSLYKFTIAFNKYAFDHSQTSYLLDVQANCLDRHFISILPSYKITDFMQKIFLLERFKNITFNHNWPLTNKLFSNQLQLHTTLIQVLSDKKNIDYDSLYNEQSDLELLEQIIPYQANFFSKNSQDIRYPFILQSILPFPSLRELQESTQLDDNGLPTHISYFRKVNLINKSLFMVFSHLGIGYQNKSLIIYHHENEQDFYKLKYSTGQD